MQLNRTLHLDANGNPVEEEDPASRTVLGGMGSTIPDDEAKRLGLLDDDGNETALAKGAKAQQPAEDKAETLTEDKARRMPAAKARG